MQRISDYFSSFLAAHPDDDALAQDFGSDFSRDVRYSVLLHASGFQVGDTLLDVGCGLTNLHDYICAKHGLEDYPSYFGVDGTPAFVARVAERRPALAQRLVLADVVDLARSGEGIAELPEAFDHVVSSGMLQMFPDVSSIDAAVGWMWSQCRKTLAFTVVHNRWPSGSVDRIYLSPHDVVSMAFARTRIVELRSGYLPNDVTVVMRREVDHHVIPEPELLSRYRPPGPYPS